MGKRLLVAFLCLELLLIIIPQAVLAADSYTYIDQYGESKTTEGLTVTPVTVDTATMSSGWYVVDNDATLTAAISVSGSVNLILVDGFTLSVTGSSDNAGINVLPGNSLTIYGQSAGTGKLSAQGGINSAGIGGRKNSASGTVTINSGTVTSIGGDYGSGIGGGYYGSGGTINVAGGTVTATGGRGGRLSGTTYLYSGAGIGGGFQGSGGTITISGGTVNATSGPTDISAGAGIGGGSYKDGGSITISGGVVTARSTQEGAGIGGGDYGTGGIIVISGGNITASSRYRGAGIGGGDMKDGGSITISDGTVNAYSEYGGSGIGGGYLASGGTINIEGGDVTAAGGLWGSGIGSGGPANAGNITISGGVIHANGGDFAAGIGAGGTNSANTHTGGTIKILGGKVFAKGYYSSWVPDRGLDIGRGRNGVNGTVLIDNAVQITLLASGVDSSVTTVETGIIQGPAAGSLLGAYEDGVIITGTMIDLSNPTLASGTGYTVSGNTITLTGSGSSYVLFGDTTSRNIVVSSGSNVNVTLFAADIRPVSGCAFNMAGATVNMRLVEDNSLSSSDGYAGLQAANGSVLTISGSGIISATGGNNGAGIGGGNGSSAGSITVTDGTVSAFGSGGGAGIGGGNGGAGGSVTATGAGTVVSAAGGVAGFDIGSGSGNSIGGSLMVNNYAIVTLNRNGTNANTSLITCTINGDGAGLPAGTYLDSQKRLTFGDVNILPDAGADAFNTVNLSVTMEGLSDTLPEGYISFEVDGVEIGQSSITRTATGSNTGTADFDWTPSAGTYALAALYVQVDVSDSYYTTEGVQLAAAYLVSKIDQAPLTISDPGTITYGDASFDLLCSGGSGTGNLFFEVTSGDAVSVNVSGHVTPESAGTVTITVIKYGDENYEEASETIEITVQKASPDAVVFPSSSSLTYGATLSASALSGGSGDGSFDWESPDTIPTVINSGYNVVFTPRDTDNYDYTDILLTQKVSLSVSKAIPSTTFPTSQTITYEDTLSDSALFGGIGDGSFDWESPDTIPTVINSGYNVIFTPDDTDNYLMVEQIVSIVVNKADQAPLTLSGIPDSLRYGDAPFDLLSSGGSGTGSIFFEATSGDAVSVNASGNVTPEAAGTATIIVIRYGDENYEVTSETIEITVQKASPDAVVFPSSRSLTYGAKLSASALSGGSGDGSFDWENPDSIPTVINSGYNVVFTPRDTDNYDYTDILLTQKVSISVSKAIPSITFPTSQTTPYEDTLSDSALSGGSGDGSFDWKSPGTIPTVINSGYNVIFTPDDTDNYLTVEQIVSIVVNKAEQAPLTLSGIPDSLRYGDAPFDLLSSGGSGTGSLFFEATSGDALAINTAGKVSVMHPGTVTLAVTKSEDSNYYSRKDSVQIIVNKADQAPLSLLEIPFDICEGDTSFNIIVAGGSGTGSLIFEVTSGDSISVDIAGKVSIIKPGTATITVTRAGDDFYNGVSASMELQVNKKAEITPTPTPTESPSPTATPTPSPSPATTPSPSPSPTPTPKPSSTPAPGTTSIPTPEPTQTVTVLVPVNVEEDSKTGVFFVDINIADLPEDATSIRLSSGEIIIIDRTQETLRLAISRDDLNTSGELEFFALNIDNSMASLKIAVSDWKTHTQKTESGIPPMWLWITIGIVGSSLVIVVVVFVLNKRRLRF